MSSNKAPSSAPEAPKPPVDNGLPEAVIPLTTINIGFWPGFLAILFTLGVIGVWSWAYPIDQSIALGGQVEASTETKAIQHLEGGIVDTVLVVEGQQVAAGDPLIKLKVDQAGAEYAALKTQRDQALIQQAMLTAKQQQSNHIIIPQEIDPANSHAQAAIAEQQSVLDSALENYHSRLALYDQRLDELRAIITGSEAQLDKAQSQVKLSAESVAKLTELRRKGHVTQTQLEQKSSELLNFEQQVDVLQTRITEAKEKLLTTEAELKVFINEEREKNAQQLSELQVALARSEEQLKQLKDVLDRTTIVAPEAGVVVNMAALGKGTVITPGEALMRILPKNDPLVIQVYIPPQSIDKVFPGQTARVMFSSFDTKQSPMIDGELRFVSDDVVQIDDQNSLYIGEITFDRKALTEEFDYRLRPGMQVNAFLDAGEITLLGFIVKPLTDSLKFVFVR